MTASAREALASYCEEPPTALIAHFDEFASSERYAEDGLLALGKACEYTDSLREALTLSERLGLVVLADRTDSNPYCYVTRGVLRGFVLKVSHDDSPSVAFNSLEEFLQAWPDNDHDFRDHVLRLDDQDALCVRTSELLNEASEASVDELQLMIALLDTSRTEAVTEIARSDDFFVREAMATQIAAHPREELLEIATTLAGDPHPQVARQGVAARKNVNRVKWAK